MRAGIELVKHYLEEAKRIYGDIQDEPELKLAEATLNWLRRRSKSSPTFKLRDVYQFGPNPVRDSKKAKKILGILQEHGWIMPSDGGSFTLVEVAE